MEDKSLNELIDSYLSDEGVEVFDNVVEGARRRSGRAKILSWSAAVLTAAAVAAMFFLPSFYQPVDTTDISSVQIAEAIQNIIDLDLGDVETINATPMGDKAILTATLRDGSTYTYIMSCNTDDGSTSILAYNQ